MKNEEGVFVSDNFQVETYFYETSSFFNIATGRDIKTLFNKFYKETI